jgi:hypothetical protein
VVTLGPAVYFVSTAAIVHGDSTIQQLSDLAGKSICFYQGDNAHLNLEASMAGRQLDFVRMGYMEYGELHHAYNARIREAQVRESGDLATARLEEPAASASRLLSEPLATFPVFAATPASDPQWSAIVTWSISALQRAELPATPWAASGLESVGEAGRDLGLVDDWVKRVVGAAGPTPTFMRAISATARLSSFRADPTRPQNSAACSSRPIENRRRLLRVRFERFQWVAARLTSHSPFFRIFLQ